MVDRNSSNMNKSDISKIHKSSISSHTLQQKDKKEKEKVKIHTFVVAGTTFTVESKYKLIKQIGQGAYGVVCSCKDTSKEANDPFYKVAIKKVPNAFEDLIDAKRILREIKLLKFFNHENIVSLLDVPKPPSKVGYDDIYIITDLMGTDLHRVIYSKQELNDEYVQFFMYQIIRAILYMHSANVIHRDLKPSNILSNADCHVKICDLGLGRGGMPESNDEEDKKNTELNHDNDDNHPLTT
jgi:mitogen-activated protein kinase 1/3